MRVYKSGRLAAGRWARGALAEELAPQACAAAVQAADRAAQAARRVKVRLVGSRCQELRRMACSVLTSKKSCCMPAHATPS